MKRDRGNIIHEASRGELAPDKAIDEGRVELVLVDASTGRPQSYGVLVDRRRVGAYQIRLAHDRAKEFWWIVAIRERPSRVIVTGFVSERADECAQCFASLTEGELDRHQLSSYQ